MCISVYMLSLVGCFQGKKGDACVTEDLKNLLFFSLSFLQSTTT